MVRGAWKAGLSQLVLQLLQKDQFLGLFAFKRIEHANPAIDCAVKDGLRPPFIEVTRLDRRQYLSHIVGNQRIQFVAIRVLVVLALPSGLELILDF